MLTLILACALSEHGPAPVGRPPHSVAVAYADAIAALPTDPASTAALCQDIADPSLHADCIATGAEQLATTNPTAASALCQGLGAGLWRDECFFQVAERAPSLGCTQAGRFETDCRMHLWGRALSKGLGPDPRPGHIEEHVAGMMAEHGLAPTDDEPWWAAYRAILSQQQPLDLGTCAAVRDERLADLCRQAGLQLYGDWLNYTRDTTGFPCEVDAHSLSGRLSYRPDPQVDALIATRRATDLCP